MRKSNVKRSTKETLISCSVNIDGKGVNKISTKIGFLDHMLEIFSTHSLIDLELKANGDTGVDLHHTVEDCGIVLGESIKKALGLIYPRVRT